MTIAVPLGRAFALIDDEDADLVLQYKWNAFVAKMGTDSLIYARRYVPATGGVHGATTASMHRMILNAPKNIWVDHRNNNGLDNRRANLRLANPQQNAVNRAAKLTKSATGFHGVYRKGEEYFGKVNERSKLHVTDLFSTARMAAVARDALALEIHGEFATLNFPTLPPEERMVLVKWAAA